MAGSIHRWSKSLPSCRVLEPDDMPRKVKGESYLFPKRDLALCTKIQTQPSTGRLYMETDIDRVRRLDELATNGALGMERQERVTENRGEGEEKEREKRREAPWEKSGQKADQGKETREKPKEIHSGRDPRKDRRTDKETERPWEREQGAQGEMMERGAERGREKQKKVVRDGHKPPPPPPAPRTPGSNGRSSPGPGLCWPEGFPSMSYRSTSLPRAAFNTVSRTVQYLQSSV